MLGLNVGIRLPAELEMFPPKYLPRAGIAAFRIRTDYDLAAKRIQKNTSIKLLRWNKSIFVLNLEILLGLQKVPSFN